MRGWKQLENSVWAELKELVSFLPALPHRFYDSRSAGAAMPSQPADFLLILDGAPIFIECKFSEKHGSLRGCFSNNVDNQQIASAKLAIRAGATYYVLFASKSYVELWPGQYLVEQREAGKRLDLSERLYFPGVKEAISWLAVHAKPALFS